jgi:hypothetical protein
MKKILLMLVILFVSSQARSQSLFSPHNINHGVGIYGNFTINSHSSNFQNLPGVPNCCEQFSTATGNGLSVGAFYELPLDPYLSLQFKFGLFNLSAKYTVEEYEPLSTDEIATIDHVIDADINTVGFDILAKYSLFGSLNAYGGFNISHPAFADFRQVENLTKPTYGTFKNGTRKRNQVSGEIENVSPLQFSLVFGISFDIQVTRDKSYILSPEFYYVHGLTNLVDNGDKWKINSLRFGLSFKYGFLGGWDKYDTPLGGEN